MKRALGHTDVSGLIPARLGCNIRLNTYDRLDPGPVAALVEFYGSEEIAVIGYCQCRHFVLCRALDEPVYLHGSIE
jgi:hypothetical protein